MNLSSLVALAVFDHLGVKKVNLNIKDRVVVTSIDKQKVVRSIPQTSEKLRQFVHLVVTNQFITTRGIEQELGIRNISKLADRANKHLKPAGFFVSSCALPCQSKRNNVFRWGIFKK